MGWSGSQWPVKAAMGSRSKCLASLRLSPTATVWHPDPSSRGLHRFSRVGQPLQGRCISVGGPRGRSLIWERAFWFEMSPRH